jgi:hypothetical protein
MTEAVDATEPQALLECERWRRTAELDALAASLDEEDKAEVRAAIAEALGG